MAKRILIVGFGNPLVGDDGAGPAVVGALRRAALPAGVRVEDGGSDSLCLFSLWQGEDEIWLVDAMKTGAAAGAIVRLAHEQILAVPQRHATVHQLSLPESLRWLAITYPELASVRYRLWGVEAERLDLEPGLSPGVAAAVPVLVAEIRAALAGPGSPAVPR
jgi:hydrogenase maturation protease